MPLAETPVAVVAPTFDRPVEEQVIHLGLGGVLADLGHQYLDFVRLHLLREDRGERLRVRVRQVACLHVLAAVRIAPQVGQTDAGDPQILELAVLADAGESDVVVDLADLVQRRGGILGDEQESVRILAE